jgi:ferredoxin-type protein NapH
MTRSVVVRQLPARQRLRRALLLVSLLLFPITLYYFSPVLIMQSASEGLINASLLVFAAMFVSSLFVGRLWCGWACPAGALQELAAPINNGRVSRRVDWIKWAIWLPWVAGIIVLAVRAGGYRAVAPFYQLDGGVTLAQDTWAYVYYSVLAVFLLLAALVGRRAGCHTICWMAPFMILGRKLRNLLPWPALRLQAAPERCRECGTCTTGCPMSLDVRAMVAASRMENAECILCGTCVDNCKQGAIRYSFAAGK